MRPRNFKCTLELIYPSVSVIHLLPLRSFREANKERTVGANEQRQFLQPTSAPDNVVNTPAASSGEVTGAVYVWCPIIVRACPEHETLNQGE